MNTTNKKEKQLVGAVLIGQSGGPTAVINASAYGVIKTALGAKNVTRVLWAGHGIKGVLDDNIYEMGAEDGNELALLLQTPAAEFGSCRKKIREEHEYARILEIFKKYDVRYFFYNGGNDSMDTCNKINDYMNRHGHPIRVWGVPKTIDNDLDVTDHCPGFGSAAKYVATTCMEISRDSHAYDTGQVTVIEIMGRNAGWLTGASALATKAGAGPDLIYLPETVFDIEVFLSTVEKLYKTKKNIVVAVSEGIRDKNGKYIAEYAAGPAGAKDSFGHAQMGGVAPILAGAVKGKLGVKVRGIELSLLQRCAAHCASATDVEESYAAGKAAVDAAVAGMTDKMAGFECSRQGGKYTCDIKLFDLADVANTEKMIPAEWINAEGNNVNRQYIDYALPLIQGEARPPFENGVPRFAKLKKEFV